MSRYLSEAEVRNHVETGLVSAALQNIMNEAEQDLDQRHGEYDSQVDDLEGGLEDIWTTRPISAITSVIETVGTTDTTLATDDYVQRHGTQLERLDTGTNARQRWGDRVKVTYTPVDTKNRRIMVFIRLIKLSIEYSGLDSSKDGDFSSKTLTYDQEREKILSALDRKGFFI